MLTFFQTKYHIKNINLFTAPNEAIKPGQNDPCDPGITQRDNSLGTKDNGRPLVFRFRLPLVRGDDELQITLPPLSEVPLSSREWRGANLVYL